MSTKTAPDRSVGFLISDVSRLLRRNFNRRVQSLGLTQTQWRAIAILSRDPGMTQVALAETLEIQPITLTRLIDRMEAAGWVERRSHPADRRAMQLYLTAKSEPVLEEMYARAAETIAEAFAGMTAAAEKQLLTSLQRMKQNLASAECASDTKTTKRIHEDVG
jgi:MarR family transcriptional regulator, transcriptional regulator for hemolysin